MKPTYLLFDHDGVLVDTERWYFEATRETLATVGADLDRGTFLELNRLGLPNWQLAADVGCNEEQIAALREQRNELYQRHIQEREIEIPAAGQVVRELSSDHRLCIVTTARRVDFELIHQNRDLTDPFEFVLTVEDYPRPKPRPDPYLAALERFGAATEESLAVEDTARGLRAALAAQLRCVIVRNEFSEDEDFRGALCVLDSIEQLPDLVRDL